MENMGTTRLFLLVVGLNPDVNLRLTNYGGTREYIISDLEPNKLILPVGYYYDPTLRCITNKSRTKSGFYEFIGIVVE